MRDFSFIAHVVEVNMAPADDDQQPQVDISIGCAVSEGFKICVRISLQDLPAFRDGPVSVPCLILRGEGAGRVGLVLEDGAGWVRLYSSHKRASAFIPSPLGIEVRRMLNNPAES